MHENDQQILDSWTDNAALWTDAVREGQIGSRVRCTDQAVIKAVLDQSPKTVLDLGCGEGWLSRALAAQGCTVTGVDAIESLIEQARLHGGADFSPCSYQQIIAGELKVQVDTLVCNFALFADESVEALLSALPSLLSKDGTLVIQTLHPVVACADQPYIDGWREGSWAGFSNQFCNPAPWYFRTLGSWITLINSAGFTLREMREPVDPETNKPASVIFIAQPS